MYSKILVCLDGSKLAEVILPYAIEQAKRYKSELILFRVYSESLPLSLAIPGSPGVPIEIKRAEKHLVEDERETETYLKSLTRKLQSEGEIKVRYDKVFGASGPSIVRYCQDHGIELIAITTHGRSGPKRAILGSVADYVIRNTSTPILLIRPVSGKIS